MAMALLPHAADARPFNPCDFDGDRKSDQVVTRFEGTAIAWWIKLSGGGIQHFFWGDVNSDMWLCPDVDGDGKADATVFRFVGSPPRFWSRLSSGGIRVQTWGSNTDEPYVTGDYDGDGRDDYAVYRAHPSGSTYWILESTGAVRVEAWGGLDDHPQCVPDYDGDGRADFGVRRESMFLRKVSSGGVDAVQWGGAGLGEVQQSADYDGDGRTDIAMTRNAGDSVQWWIRSSVFGQPVAPYGNGFFFGAWLTDLRVAADFDGDGRADVAVYREGVWWIQGTAVGLTVVAWGGDDAIPVHANYWR
jgi:hypothetical protein